ncbi:MAG: cytosine permease [Thermoplasmatales archaeon]|nr:cytosine permease [Thermoplasmatales archaeon]
MSNEHKFGTPSDLNPSSTTSTTYAKEQKSVSLFYIWFAANLTIGDFAIGFIPVSLGQPVYPSIIALTIGNITGGLLLAAMSVTGVLTRKPQMALSFGPFGRAGASVMSLLQWGNTLGWLTVNLVLAAFALDIIMGNVNFIIPIAVVATVVLVLAYYGHEAIRKFELAMSVSLGILFLAISLEFVFNSGSISYSPVPVIPVLSGFGITLASSFSYLMAWGPYAADYSRFVKDRREKSRSFYFTFLGGVIASFWIELLGMGVAIATSDSISNPATALARFMGGYFAVGMIALFLGGIAANAINLYSNGLSLNTVLARTGMKLPIFIGTIVSVALGIIGYYNFYSFYEIFLLILDYWITPWLGILIIHYFYIQRRTGNGTVAVRKFSGISSYCLAVLVSVPFMSPPAYFVGPIAALFNGVDVSYYVSFILAAVFYAVLNRQRTFNKTG